MNKSWRQHPTMQQLFGYLPPITKTIQVRLTTHAGHCWRSKNELISDVLLWTPSHGWTKAGCLARTYIQQLCAHMGCDLENLPEDMGDREGWRERVSEICADGPTWWWWWWLCAKELLLLLLFTPWEFFTSVLADSLSLEFEWQQVSSSLLEYSRCSGHSQ